MAISSPLQSKVPTGSTQTIKKLQTILLNRTKVRREIFQQQTILQNRRIENERRKQREDELEAPNLVTKPSGAAGLIAGSAKGFFERLVGFLSYLTAGWIINNLPTWIAMGKEFIARTQQMGKILGNFVGNTTNIFKDFTKLLGASLQNLMTFDFSDTSGRVSTAFDDLNLSVENWGTDFENAIKLITTPLSEGIASGENARPLGTENTNEGAYETGAPYSGSGSGGGTYSESSLISAMDRGGITDKNERAMFLAQMRHESGNFKYDEEIASGKDYEGRKDLGNVNPGDGVRYKGRGYIQLTGRANYRTYGNKIGVDLENNPDLAKRPDIAAAIAIAYWNSRVNKNAARSGDVKTVTYNINGGSRGLSERQKYFNDYVKKGTSVSQPTSTPTPAQTTSAPSKPISTGKLSLIPQTGSGGFIQGGSGSKGETQYATHFHIDHKGNNPNSEQLANIREVAFHATKAMLARGSTVYYGNIKQFASGSDSNIRSLIAAEQAAHDARSSAGVDIQESNPKIQRTFPSQVGSKTKFPFAVGSVSFRGGYGREAEIIGTSGITVSHGAPGSSGSEQQISAQSKPQTPSPAQITPTGTPQNPQISQSLSQERTGPTVIVTQNPSLPARQMMYSGGGGSSGGGSPQISEFTLLNNFIKNKLLLDLAYL